MKVPGRPTGTATSTATAIATGIRILVPESCELTSWLVAANAMLLMPADARQPQLRAMHARPMRLLGLLAMVGRLMRLVIWALPKLRIGTRGLDMGTRGSVAVAAYGSHRALQGRRDGTEAGKSTVLQIGSRVGPQVPVPSASGMMGMHLGIDAIHARQRQNMKAKKPAPAA